MITQEQASYALAKEYVNCGFTTVVPNGEDFKWSHIIWNEDNATSFPTAEATEALWNDKWKAEWDVEQAEIVQRATDQASGNQKLLDLGLSQSEVDSLIKG